MILIFFILLGALVIIHMARPRFLRRELSAARFFNRLPRPQQTKFQLKLGKPPITLSFILQLAVLVIGLTALILSLVKFGTRETEQLGVWFLVDTSASMSTVQEGSPRTKAVQKEIQRLLEGLKARAAKKDLDICYRLSAFDMERRDILTMGDENSINRAAGNLEPRPLGTDLLLVRGLLGNLEDQSSIQCPVTHLVVVSDCPVPGWVSDLESRSGEGNDRENGNGTDSENTTGHPGIIWRDISQPVDNIGITAVLPARNPLTGLVREVNIQVTGYGVLPKNAVFKVIGPDGAQVMETVLRWRGDKTWHGEFKPTVPGRYRLNLEPGGAYTYDDSAIIDVADEEEIRVDWRLTDRRWLNALGWVDDRVSPHLAVVPAGSDMNNWSLPVMMIGKGYRKYSNKQTGMISREEIRDFIEGNPLLEDVNLDAVESLGLEGIDLSAGYVPVLRGVSGRVWLGVREEPLGVYVPGLPTGTDDSAGRFSALVFFNGLRWLLRERKPEPLYQLTSPSAMDVSGNRNVLHRDEGNTQRKNGCMGDISSMGDIGTGTVNTPFWPVLIALALLVFLVERVYAISRMGK